MFPRIDSADAGRCRGPTHLRYPPAGDRGVATYNRIVPVRARPGRADRADDEVLGVVQIETLGAAVAASTRSPPSTVSTCCSSDPAT